MRPISKPPDWFILVVSLARCHMASRFGDMLRMFTEFSFCISGPFAQFTGWDLVFLLEERDETQSKETNRLRRREVAQRSTAADDRAINLYRLMVARSTATARHK
ncbi:hypothetical protein EVAR_79135_1 [Eumeta japonica]|uniref:Uncharacterized protein n=1 Tax=Eumeta variegata TaxID=151549 RepID=A0A4C1UUC5_EUMVA|nr:hypothetical protein EVAR_79135_1 [Eumeta japonica]